MPDFRRVSEPDASAATVRIFGVDGQTAAQITWPASDKKSSLIDDLVGRQLQVPVALALVGDALALGTIERVAVLIEDEALWDERWGRLM